MIDLKKPIRFKNKICRMNKILCVSPGWAAIMVEYVSWNSRIAEAAVAVYSLVEFDETFENEIEVKVDEPSRTPREYAAVKFNNHDFGSFYADRKMIPVPAMAVRTEILRLIEWPEDAPLPDLPP